ncbi:MAG: PAS domain S-box protein [Terracidiphilus sp.]
MAANQAAIGLQEARLLREQKRIAIELDQRVGLRTKELAETNEELQLQVGLLQHIPVAAWTLKPDGRPDFVNQVWLEYTGQTIDFVRSRPEAWLAALHPDDREVASKKFWDGVRSGQGFEMETRFLRAKDGTYRWHLNRAVVLRDAEGKTLKFVGTSTDIEDVKQSQDNLRGAEERTRLIIDTALDAVITMDAQGTITSWNKQAEIIFGWSYDEAIGRRMSEMVIPERQRALHERGLRHFLATGDGPILRRRIEATALRRGGAEFPAELQVMPMRLGPDWVFSAFIRDITDAKLAEEKLRQSELNSRKILDGIPGFVCTLSPVGQVELPNRRLLEYFGKTLEEVNSWSSNDLVHPDDLPRVTAEVTHSFTIGTPFDSELRYRRADGVYRWFQVRILPERDLEGRITKWYGLITDIEDRKRAEDALRASENNLRQTVNSIPGLVCTMSPAGEIEELNQQLLEYFGKKPEELRSWKMTDAVHPDDLPRVLTAFTYSMTTGTPYEIEHRCRRADGVYQWFQVRAHAVRDTNDRTTGWYVLLTDIDDRKRAEEELRRSEAFLAQGQRLNLTGTFSWKLDTDEITFSEQAYRIFELDPGTTVTLEQIGMRVHPDDIPLFSEKMTEARSVGDDHDYGMRLRMPDDRVKHVHLVSHTTRHQDTRLEYIGAIQDVTEDWLSEEALSKIRSELAHMTRVASLGALTASIAHEVNQPLSGIMTNAGTCLRMLTADPPNVDGALETARRTIRDANRATDVIKRLRALFTKKKTATETVDLNEATREVIALSLNEIQRNQVVLRTDFSENLPVVMGDRIQIQQVILNLLMNASDAMSNVDDRPRELVIGTAQDGNGCVRFSVKDVGVGFGSHNTEKFFEAFYTTKSSGMGIGLSVSRSIIESHEGRLWATPNDGPGATFSFSIPCRLPVAETLVV